MCGLAWNLSACDQALGLNEFSVAEDSAQDASRTGPLLTEATLDIALISSNQDRSEQRSNGARLAIEAINQAGGIPDGKGGKRWLDLSTAVGSDVGRALKQLEAEGPLLAVIGPDSSDQTFNLLKSETAEADLLTLTPNCTVDSIVSGDSADFNWSLVPSDGQRMPLVLRALSEIEAALQPTRAGRDLRLSVLYADNAFGRGLRAALEGQATWGELGLMHPDNLGRRVQFQPYDPLAVSQSALVYEQVELAPDAVVVVGMAEVVSQIIAPLEYNWRSTERPEYLLMDPAKGSELLRLIAQSPGLVDRVRGIGAIPTVAAQQRHQDFLQQYEERFGDESDEPAGIEAATAYDSVFVIAYALASAGDQAPSGELLARRMRRLSGGALQVDGSETQLEAALAALARGDSIDASGTLSSFRWDTRGGIASGAVEVWCVTGAESPRFASSGLRLDIAGQTFLSVPSDCVPLSTSRPTVAPPEAIPTISASDASVGTPASDAMRSEADGGVPGMSQAAPPQYSLSVHYQANNSVPNDNSIGPFIRIVNAADGMPVPLRQLSVRYYLDNEHADRCPASCLAEVSYAGKQPSGDSVRASSHFVATNGTRGYLEVAFNEASAALRAGETLEVQQHFHTTPYLPFDESNDYSFDPTALRFRPTQRITAYVSNNLVSGVEPPQ